MDLWRRAVTAASIENLHELGSLATRHPFWTGSYFSDGSALSQEIHSTSMPALTGIHVVSTAVNVPVLSPPACCGT
jgi:hypothetical protein